MREESLFLINEKDLEIKGTLQQSFVNSNGDILRATLEYVADKLGYRTKYKYETDAGYFVEALSGSTLYSLAG